jgi:hypothetical protein
MSGCCYGIYTSPSWGESRAKDNSPEPPPPQPCTEPHCSTSLSDQGRKACVTGHPWPLEGHLPSSAETWPLLFLFTLRLSPTLQPSHLELTGQQESHCHY